MIPVERLTEIRANATGRPRGGRDWLSPDDTLALLAELDRREVLLVAAIQLILGLEWWLPRVPPSTSIENATRTQLQAQAHAFLASQERTTGEKA